MSALGRNSLGLPGLGTAGRAVDTRNATGRKNLPNVERLESLLLLSVGCPVISGFVFLDQNSNPALTNNGILNPGELPVPGAQVELFDSSNHLLATTKSDIHGAYSFDGLPNTNGTPVTMPAKTITLPPTLTPFANKQISASGVQLFDPELGTLTSVTISHSVTLAGVITTQNLSPSSPANITLKFAGNYTINGLSPAISGSGSQTEGPIVDGPFDPANPDGNKLPPITLSANDSPPPVTLTSASDLAFYTASANRSTIKPTMTATALGVATSDAGALDTDAVTAGSASLSITYTYIPKICISPGTYTLVQTPNPPQLINGKVGSSRVDLQACKLEYSIVSPK